MSIPANQYGPTRMAFFNENVAEKVKKGVHRRVFGILSQKETPLRIPNK